VEKLKPFPQINLWVCPLHEKDLGILDIEVIVRWINHLGLEHGEKLQNF
jgi:hypothetical protein